MVAGIYGRRLQQGIDNSAVTALELRFHRSSSKFLYLRVDFKSNPLIFIVTVIQNSGVFAFKFALGVSDHVLELIVCPFYDPTDVPMGDQPDADRCRLKNAFQSVFTSFQHHFSLFAFFDFFF